MHITVNVNENLIYEIEKLIGKKDKDVIVKEALELLLSTIKNQKKLMDLRGNVRMDDEAYN